MKKIGTLIITLVVISFLSFLAFYLIPGDAAVANLGMDADEDTGRTTYLKLSMFQ